LASEKCAFATGNGVESYTFRTRFTASLPGQAGEGYQRSLLVGALSAIGASSLKTSGEGHVSRMPIFSITVMITWMREKVNSFVSGNYSQEKYRLWYRLQFKYSGYMLKTMHIELINRNNLPFFSYMV